MKPAVVVKETAKPATPATRVVNAVYFGLDDRLLLNVTAGVIERCMSETDAQWLMPADDAVRASLFGDPIPNVLKKVYVRVLAADGKSFSESLILSSDTCRFDYVDGKLSFVL